MNNFKIGDTVRRVRTWGGSDGLRGGEVGVVSVLHGSNIVEIKGYGDWSHLTESLELVEQVDDELPPAPESVLYIGLQQHVHRRLQVTVCTAADGGSVVDLHIGGGKLGDGKSCALDPDAALQLAHDLNRMANEIKRKEKQQ